MPTRASTPPAIISSTSTPPPSAASRAYARRGLRCRDPERDGAGLGLVQQPRDDRLDDGLATDLGDGLRRVDCAVRRAGRAGPAAVRGEQPLELDLVRARRPQSGRRTVAASAGRGAILAASRAEPGQRPHRPGRRRIGRDAGSAQRGRRARGEVVRTGASREHRLARSRSAPAERVDDPRPRRRR